MTAPSRRVTISISVPSIVHLGIGAALGITAVTAFVIYFNVPHAAVYRSVFGVCGVVATFAVMTYWLWCVMQRLRADHDDLGDTIAESMAEAAAREDRLLAVLQEFGAQVDENTGAIKKLADGIAACTGAVEALQDTYFEEGRALVLPADELDIEEDKEGRREEALAA